MTCKRHLCTQTSSVVGAATSSVLGASSFFFSFLGLLAFLSFLNGESNLAKRLGLLGRAVFSAGLSSVAVAGWWAMREWSRSEQKWRDHKEPLYLIFRCGLSLSIGCGGLFRRDGSLGWFGSLSRRSGGWVNCRRRGLLWIGEDSF